jgi:ATP/maltotriose-dependent transcriptional regulator MalT
MWLDAIQARLPDWHNSKFAVETAKLVWINAAAGFGKTVLCASVIQHFALSSSDPLAFFFFSAAETPNDHFSCI